MSLPVWAKGPATWGGGSAIAAHQENKREVARANAAGRRYDVAVYGDSITHVLAQLRDTAWSRVAYEPLFGKVRHVGLFGVPGNDVEDLTWRLVGGTERLRPDPRLIVLWIGTNNLGQGTSPVDKLDFLLGWLRANTGSRLACMAILPSTRYQTAAANRAIARVCAGHGAAFWECADAVRADARALLPDGLHPSPAGYAAALGCLGPRLAAALAAAPAPRREGFVRQPRKKAAPPPRRRGGPVVGLFVHTWHDINPAGQRAVQTETTSYATAWYWWGRPAFAGGDLAQYTWGNQAMVDYHIDNFRALGVDFVFLDFTNGNHPENLAGAHALCRRLQARGDGPKVAFWVERVADAPLYRRQFYDAYPGVMFRWEGKPLLLVRPVNTTGRPPPPPLRLDGFTARWCWGLLGAASSDMWTFKERDPPRPYVHAGRVEQVGMTFATQATYMTEPAGRKCRDGGRFFESQVTNVLRHKPRIVTITGYNEWMAINTGSSTRPVFVDLSGPECSHDIEPMRGGHGDRYFKQAAAFVRRLRSAY